MQEQALEQALEQVLEQEMEQEMGRNRELETRMEWKDASED